MLRALAQEPVYSVESPPAGKVYITESMEWLFTQPVLDVNGNDRGGVTRFAPVLNMYFLANLDMSTRAGLFAGLSVRNHGFIFNVPDTSLSFKYRTYTLGVPVGIKLGRMHGGLFFAGYSIEAPLNYKEKRFGPGRKDKEKFNVWFSDRVLPWQQSIWAGFQTGGGMVLSVRYHLTNFHNTAFTETTGDLRVLPYAGLKANVVTLGLSFDLFNAERTIIDELPFDRQRDVTTQRRAHPRKPSTLTSQLP
jgi:hypothetical protein